MKFFRRAQSAFAILFIAALAIVSILNFATRLPLFQSKLNQLPADSGLNDAIHTVDYVANSSILGEEELVYSHSLLQVLLGKEESGGFEIIKGNNGELDYGNFYPVLTTNTEEYALRMRRLLDYESSRDSHVMFINAIDLFNRDKSNYAADLPVNDQNTISDAMLYYLQSYGVDYLDSRKVLKESSLSPDQYRYNTDIHWTVEAGFEVFAGIIEKLSYEYDLDLDPDSFYTNPDSYKKSVFPQSYVGILGQRAGTTFSGKDDFLFIEPDFETQFTLEYIRNNTEYTMTGDFKEALINHSYWDNGNLYASYLSGQTQWKRITNERSQTGPRFLFICDSFAMPIISFLAPMASEIHVICPLTDQPPDLEEYVLEQDFDFVFVEYFPGNITEQGFDFFRR